MEPVHALQPAIILLVVGILAIMLTRPARLSPIVGYLLAGVLIGPHGFGVVAENDTTRLLAELGVVFLLFDIGVHFSLGHLWDARRAILGFGPLQVGLCTLGLAGGALALGFDVMFAVLIGAALALSSTAVAVQTLAERGQQRCPVGVTATAVLVFQDICAIFLLILANSLETRDVSLGSAFGAAALKAVAAFGTAILLGRLLIGPLFNALAKSKNEEVFTATALLTVLVAAGATGIIGLSLTLGAFLGGMIISETPYRHVIRTEVKPFRGLLLGFFFITVGMSLDTAVLFREWAQILLFLLLLLSSKTVLIFLAARVLRVPLRAAVQLGFLLSQGSEFAFVIFGMPALYDALGPERVAIAITGVAASLALTPSLAALGYQIAIRLASQELAACQGGESTVASQLIPAVIIFGMGEVGRCVADGLEAHAIPYTAIEMAHDRFIRAHADGYPVAFGDLADPRLIETIQTDQRSMVVVTIARYEVSRELTPILHQRYPHLIRFVAVDTDAEKARFEMLGMKAVVIRSIPRGLDLAVAVLKEQGISDQEIYEWMHRQQEKALETVAVPEVSAEAA
jgi:monovalent cation:proton antiporter-2 (CPA2) family protein